MRIYGIRGATTITANTKEGIIQETKKLLEAVIEANQLKQEDVVSIIFTTTPDVTAEFPAKVCRMMGWEEVPLLGAVEADVPHGLLRCIRVLLHVYLQADKRVKHIYLNEAVKLRPDLVKKSLSE